MSLLRATRSARRLVRPFSTSLPIDVHPEIQEALAHNKPVVALETALVTNGLPHPINFEVGQSLEKVVRSTGAIPATIGLVGGRVKIGLSNSELARLAERTNNPAKISRRDIAAAIATGADGGTTCSATLVFSALAGIKVFATGGLGGVHRGGQDSFDISADLHELSRCPVGLVSSGVKSILDIGRTLEYLETLGVPVVSYGSSKEFPAFFSRHSGYELPWNVDNPLTAAKLIYTQQQLQMQNGVLIAVPIPEKHEAAAKEIQAFVDQAVAESEANGVSKRGKEATPWLLSRIAELTQGRSIESNIALLENTALIGGQIAIEYQKLAQESQEHPGHDTAHLLIKSSYQPASVYSSDPAEESPLPNPDVVVIGSAALDITAQEHENANAELVRHSTGPGHVRLSLGGVARNMAEAAHRVMEVRYPGSSCALISPIGEDTFGQVLVDELRKNKMRTDGLVTTSSPTAVCNMLLDSKGTLVGGVADMDITQNTSADQILKRLSQWRPKVVGLDANLSEETIASVVRHANESGVKVLFEPTSRIKSSRILPVLAKGGHVDFCTPNLLELVRLYEVAQSESYDLLSTEKWWSTVNSFNIGSSFRMDLEQLARRKISDKDTTGDLSFLIQQGIAQMAVNLLPFFQNLVIKCGDQGALVAMVIPPEDAAASSWRNERSNARQRYVVAQGRSGEVVVLQHFPPQHVEHVANVTGAGDSFVGTLLAVLSNSPSALHDVDSMHKTVESAQRAAVLTLGSHLAVSPYLSIEGRV